MKKRLFIVLLIVIIIILLIPQKWRANDGGTVEYHSFLYSVTNYHSIKPEGGYNTGIEVKILGLTVYENTTFDD